jgi:hypothetical protein
MEMRVTHWTRGNHSFRNYTVFPRTRSGKSSCLHSWLHYRLEWFYDHPRIIRFFDSVKSSETETAGASSDDLFETAMTILKFAGVLVAIVIFLACLAQGSHTTRSGAPKEKTESHVSIDGSNKKDSMISDQNGSTWTLEGSSHSFHTEGSSERFDEPVDESPPYDHGRAGPQGLG